MEVVYVSRSNSGKPHPFVKEQADALIRNFKINIQHFLIASGGIAGYSKAVLQLAEFVSKSKADIIHVHYGLSALVAVLNKLLFFKKYKIIITYHGSDINKDSERKFSLLAARFSAHNILVSEKMLRYFKNDFSVIPCGIDTDIELNQREATRAAYQWRDNDFVVLFSSSFTRQEKDPEFAFKVIDALAKETSKSVKFIELKGFTRSQLTSLMQAADALILCSQREGSPQVIKEAILNGLPVVANDIGDVKAICEGADNCFIVPKTTDEFVKALKYLATAQVRVQNRSLVINRFDNNLISNKLYNIYSTVLKYPCHEAATL
jgi:glycosyltransferase involved in cell wall biosynthesis